MPRTRSPRAVFRAVGFIVLPAWPGAAAHAADKKPIPVSGEVELSGNIERPRLVRLADLQAEPVTTIQVYFSTGSGPVAASFKGVPLWALLQKAGISSDRNVDNAGLQHTGTIAATDGYRVVFSVGE